MLDKIKNKLYSYTEKGKMLWSALKKKTEPMQKKWQPMRDKFSKFFGFFQKYSIFYIVVCFGCLFYLDYIARFPYMEFGMLWQYDNISTFFVLAWCLFLTFIIYLLPGRIKKFAFVFLIIFIIVYTCGQSVFYFLFKKFFSVADISLAQEGADFADASYFQITPLQFQGCVAVLIISILNCFLMPKKKKPSWKIGTAFIGCIATLFISAFQSFPEAVNPSLWAANKVPTNVYQNFTNTTYNYLMCGVYQYMFKDVYLSFVPVERLSNAEVINRLDDYYEELKEPQHIDNEMTGRYANKNVILLQLENIDTWMMNDLATPALSYMKKNGIDFINHYSASFSTGRTFNTEFIVNTGMIPPTKGEAPSYIFSRNVYPFAMGNIFQKAGYTTESYHPNGSNAYNRTDAHRNFGYTKYHDWEDLNMDDWMMDSGMTNGFKDMVRESPYMDFIITISGHSPFSFESTACNVHFDEIVPFSPYADEQYLCAQAQARETDVFIRDLLEKLDAADELKNTVFVIYTDHFAYGTLSDDFFRELKGTSDPNLLQKTPFFIWSMDTEPMQVKKVTSSIDILPTVANLFDLPTEYQYYIGHDAFDSSFEGYVYFEDGSLYDGKTYYNPAKDTEVQGMLAEKLQNSMDRLQRSWDLLISNYFSGID